MEADEIDPQAKAAMEAQERIPMPHSRWGVKLLRGFSSVTARIQNRTVPEVGAVSDLTVPGPDGELDARLYLPDRAGTVPTVVFFHGGGYVLGSIATHERLCRRLVQESGCAVLSVEYRLAPEHPFPAAVEDAYAAVEWVGDNPGELPGDGRLAVAGDSAGGNLAAVSALMAAERGGPEVDYQLLLYPSVGVDPDHPSVRDHTGLVLSEEDMRFFRQCYFQNEIHQRNPYADPIHARDLSDVPPATVLTAGFDPLRDGGKAYAERLVDEGVDTRYENYEDMVHGFLTFRDVDRTEEAIEDVAGDLAAALDTR
ncbi:alpha/beta hydrolase fold domain-containing protein [Halovenus sp. WSH3]|uniref:Alpha/beta hydrolase fold domain-containing protein n=1 Tax=Halovenus carboxidivorans TaxID=2692199 RepID=A0A6B0T7M3_9EURY|nr:alpha/beta hydrolase [Halovenus carboxidivorans]MXR50890.1 alpha/beta hydrolase fold domain-containing protein [Halovenus carboxidivorans]